MRRKIERKIIGVVGVDSGMLLISDPSYVLHQSPPRFECGRTWTEFCQLIDTEHQLSTPRTNIPLAVNFGDFGGDGVFQVVGEYEGKLLKKVIIQFER